MSDMTNTPHTPEEVVDRVELEGWDDAHVEQRLARLHRARDQRRVLRTRVAVLTAAAAVVAVGWLAWPRARPAGEAPSVATRTPAGPSPEVAGELRFEDGSRAIPTGRDSRLVPVLATSTEVRVRLERGAGAFEVTPEVERRFVVEVGSLQVIVLGTAFGVERHGDQAYVNVTRGLVRVRWPSGEAMLPAGAEGTFPCGPAAEPAALTGQPPAASAPAVESDDDTTASVSTPATASAPASGAGTPTVPAPVSAAGASWREHALAGRHAEAFEALGASDAAPVRDQVEDLMLAADAARLSGHGAEALRYLERVAVEHADHSQAALASFTMGRILSSRGQAVDAARAFARARAQAPSGSLAQDALAREVEAWHRAGDTARAHALALEYVARFPAGRRLAAVRRYGGLP